MKKKAIVGYVSPRYVSPRADLTCANTDLISNEAHRWIPSATGQLSVPPCASPSSGNVKTSAMATEPTSNMRMAFVPSPCRWIVHRLALRGRNTFLIPRAASVFAMEAAPSRSIPVSALMQSMDSGMTIASL